MEDAELTADELSGAYLELYIRPVPMDEEIMAWEAGVQLFTDGGVECDISNLLYEFSICLNVHGMFEDDEKDSFTETNAIALVDIGDADGEEILLDSELIIVPDERSESMVDEAEYFSVVMPIDAGEPVEVYYEPAIDLEYYRNYALSCSYAGPGAYLLAEVEEEDFEEDFEEDSEFEYEFEEEADESWEELEEAGEAEDFETDEEIGEFEDFVDFTAFDLTAE